MGRHTSEWRTFPVVLCGSLLVIVLALSGEVDAAIKELANDSFSGTGSITCQIGFVAGESGAVKLTADPGDYPYQVLKIRMLVCPASTSGNIILRIYEDNTGTVLPGPVLYEEIVQIIGSDEAFNELDLSLNNIIIPSGSVRVELNWYDVPPPPGLAHDDDWFVPNVNYIYAEVSPGVYQWFYADAFSVFGDWIIRMEIETDAETPIFADGFESGDTIAWSIVTP
jgi:hypothetical protein